MMKNIVRFPIVNFIPWIVLFLSLVITYQVWRAEENMISQAAEARFLNETEHIESAIIERLQKHELMLRGGIALFQSSVFVDRSEWRTYVSAIDPKRNYPGIQAVGFAQRVSAADKEAHIRSMRAEGFANYRIWPDGVRDEYFPIMYIEPFRERNLRAFSYDMFSESVRRVAMEEARDVGVTAITGKVTLVQETDTDVQQGFLMYLPLYAKNSPLTTVQDRRAALQGFVYSPFRVNDFMHGIFGRGFYSIGLEMYDGRNALSAALLYRSGNAAQGVLKQRATCLNGNPNFNCLEESGCCALKPCRYLKWAWTKCGCILVSMPTCWSVFSCLW